jgi:O-succinylbenzoate synthase
MNIKTIDIFHITIPVLKPFETSFGVVAERPLLIFKLETEDGIIGFGESSPLYIPISEKEVLAEGVRVLKQVLPEVIGQEISHPSEVYKMLPDLESIPVSRLGLEGALYVAQAVSEKKSLQEVFGGTRQVVEAGASIGIYKTMEEVFSEIDLALSQGLKRVKLKIKPGHDIEVVKAVRERYPTIPLGVDANASYKEGEIEVFKQMDAYNLMFIEQPYHADAYDAHATLRREVTSPVCLDETICDLETTKLAIEKEACDIVNIKPARIGSYSESIEIHNACVKHKIPLFGGGRMESGLGRFFNIALYSLPWLYLPIRHNATVGVF